MKICIFGSASMRIDAIYIEKVEALGEMLALHGHSLVFGAGSTGLMGAAARGFKKGGGYIHGVVPTFFRDEGVGHLFDGCDKVTYTQTMSQRKATMEDDADAFIIVPGGIGTFEEFFEVLTLKQLGRHSKAIALYNVENYYDGLKELLQTVSDRKFTNFEGVDLCRYFDNADAMLDYIENYVPATTPWHDYKV